MEALLILLYFVVGAVVVVYDYHLNHRKDYWIAKKAGNANDSVLMLYWTAIMIIWLSKGSADWLAQNKKESKMIPF